MYNFFVAKTFFTLIRHFCERIFLITLLLVWGAFLNFLARHNNPKIILIFKLQA
jgi:hypothetical protein